MINFILVWFYFKSVLIKDIYVGKYLKLKFKYLIKNKIKILRKNIIFDYLVFWIIMFICVWNVKFNRFLLEYNKRCILFYICNWKGVSILFCLMFKEVIVCYMNIGCVEKD